MSESDVHRLLAATARGVNPPEEPDRREGWSQHSGDHPRADDVSCVRGYVGNVRVEDPGSDIDFGISEAELTELALAADPDTPLSDDAVPIDVHLSSFGAALPLWYMPPVARSGRRRWSRPVVLAVVAAFVLIDALGLCNTYGVLSL
jgi:hypothetical protein